MHCLISFDCSLLYFFLAALQFVLFIVGSAVGFRLDSLLKLSDTRARNNKMTLMHYLSKVYICSYRKVDSFSTNFYSLARKRFYVGVDHIKYKSKCRIFLRSRIYKFKSYLLTGISCIGISNSRVSQQF